MKPERTKISCFIVTFNEERHIASCIESVKFCDEILVIDSHSTDRTVEIAEGLGAKVIQRDWPGYRAQKLFGLQSVSNEWVLNIDADERVSPELRESIIRILSEDTGDEIVGYNISRVVFFLGRWWRTGGWYPEYRLRFFKRSRVSWGGVEPHEKVITDGRTERINGELFHYTYADLGAQLRRLESYSGIAAAEEFKQGERCSVSSLVCNPLIRFVKFYLFKRGYREGMAGFIVAVNEAFYTFMKYAKLWELSTRAGVSTKDIGEIR